VAPYSPLSAFCLQAIPSPSSTEKPPSCLSTSPSLFLSIFHNSADSVDTCAHSRAYRSSLFSLLSLSPSLSLFLSLSLQITAVRLAKKRDYVVSRDSRVRFYFSVAVLLLTLDAAHPLRSRELGRKDSVPVTFFSLNLHPPSRPAPNPCDGK